MIMMKTRVWLTVNWLKLAPPYYAAAMSYLNLTFIHNTDDNTDNTNMRYLKLSFIIKMIVDTKVFVEHNMPELLFYMLVVVVITDIMMISWLLEYD